MFKYNILAIFIILVCFWVNKLFGVAVLGLFIIYAGYSFIPHIYAFKASTALSKGSEEDALKLYEKAYRTGRANLLIKVSYSYILIKTGNPEKAEAILNEILQNKRLPEAKRNLAKQNRCMAIYSQGRLEEAMEEAETLFENYKNTVMYAMLGYFKLLANQDLDEILKFCLEAYEFNSDDRDILDNLSIAYYKKGEYEKAREISDKLLKMAPRFIEAYYHGAQIAEKCGETEYALELLEKIKDCNRSYLTTVSEEEILKYTEKLKGSRI
ncbi:MAG: tetratricopeptide repeat protein [Clostridia bacterium]|nr:tetratricopeptide repeat protein [Clostridia bacterium]